MSARSLSCFGHRTLTPFLYPSVSDTTVLALFRQLRVGQRFHSRCNSTFATSHNASSSHLDPSPDNFSLTPFADRCIVTLEAGSGGHGCVSFVREKYIEEGPANGGDGGSGGNIYIQAIRGETSLHKLARRRLIKAGRGRNGQGKLRGGERGADVVITVPVGTVIREISRHDPIADAEMAQRKAEWSGKKEEPEETEGQFRRDKWLVFPGLIPSQLTRMNFPALPKARKSPLAALQPEQPIWLDLDKHMETPLLLAAGAMGGYGNPHFINADNSRPKMATKGDEGMKISLQLELKILADLGLVGLPNAGKSTLLRALSNSRARIGNWAFTTLQPNVGTVVLDNHHGRPTVTKRRKDGELRENFTIADVPGLIEDAHLNKGLGLGFLRHVERAATLAFVIDLAAGDAVAALKLLWKEVSEYERLRSQEASAESQRRVTYRPAGFQVPESEEDIDEQTTTALEYLPMLSSTPISAKPWFVVATKADLLETQKNFEDLEAYLRDLNAGVLPHPSGRTNAWKRDVKAVPVSAIRAEGVDAIPRLVMDLLEE